MYKLVIFDMDGTVLNTLEDLADNLNAALSLHGFAPRTLSEVRSFIGNGALKLVSRALPPETSPEILQTVYDDYKKIYNSNVNNKTRPYAGIIELMQNLKSGGVKIAVNTNKPHDAMLLLNKSHFAGLLDFAQGAFENQPKKPDPAGVNAILQNLQVEAKDTVYVGDSDIDFLTARNAGIDSVGVLWGFRDEEYLKQFAFTHFARTAADLQKIILQ